MRPEERAACWKFYAKKYEIPSGDAIPEDDGWTGSEIKECCKLAYQLQLSLVEASAFVVPVSRSSAERIKALRQSASGKYISASAAGVYVLEEQVAEAGGPKGRRVQLEESAPVAVQARGRRP